MKKYQTPELDIELIQTADVICTSFNGDLGEDEGGFQPLSGGSIGGGSSSGKITVGGGSTGGFSAGDLFGNR